MHDDGQSRASHAQQQQTVSPLKSIDLQIFHPSREKREFCTGLCATDTDDRTQQNATIYTKLKHRSISCVRNPSSSTRLPGEQSRFWPSSAMVWGGAMANTEITTVDGTKGSAVSVAVERTRDDFVLLSALLLSSTQDRRCLQLNTSTYTICLRASKNTRPAAINGSVGRWHSQL